MYRGQITHHGSPRSNLIVAGVFSCLTIFQFSSGMAASGSAQNQLANEAASLQAKHGKKSKAVQVGITKTKSKAKTPQKVSYRGQSAPDSLQMTDTNHGRNYNKSAIPVSASQVNPTTVTPSSDSAGSSDLQPLTSIPAQQSISPSEIRRRQSKAFSQEQRPALLFVPRASEFLADLGYTYSQGTASGQVNTGARTTPLSIKVENNLGTMKFAYGMDQLYFGLGIDYATGNMRRTTDGVNLGSATTYSRERNMTIEGMGDPTLFGGYLLKTESLTTVFSVNGSISPDKNTTDEPSGNSTVNRFSGGNTIGFSGAIFNHDARTLLIGAQAGYLVLFDRSLVSKSGIDNGDTRYTLSGGNTYSLKLFMELPQAGHLGLEYGYAKSDRVKRRIETSTPSDSTVEPNSIQTVAGYLNLELNENFSLIPSLTYSTISGSSNPEDYIDKNSSFGGSIIGRIKF